eukprot:TRINITY_DN143810_c1_g1_i1.p1 TRINITY_DN143810_c1_g1~~TRINITY_DN143810_c1_g1_i1.p1  ORF type:complete len:1057 (-),score=308.85 TRINITY_DN143810_c1_g1_i1:164-3334(-)
MAELCGILPLAAFAEKKVRVPDNSSISVSAENWAHVFIEKSVYIWKVQPVGQKCEISAPTLREKRIPHGFRQTNSSFVRTFEYKDGDYSSLGLILATDSGSMLATTDISSQAPSSTLKLPIDTEKEIVTSITPIPSNTNEFIVATSNERLFRISLHQSTNGPLVIVGNHLQKPAPGVISGFLSSFGFGGEKILTKDNITATKFVQNKDGTFIMVLMSSEHIQLWSLTTESKFKFEWECSIKSEFARHIAQNFGQCTAGDVNVIDFDVCTATKSHKAVVSFLLKVHEVHLAIFMDIEGRHELLNEVLRVPTPEREGIKPTMNILQNITGEDSWRVFITWKSTGELSSLAFPLRSAAAPCENLNLGPVFGIHPWPTHMGILLFAQNGALAFSQGSFPAPAVASVDTPSDLDSQSILARTVRKEFGNFWKKMSGKGSSTSQVDFESLKNCKTEDLEMALLAVMQDISDPRQSNKGQKWQKEDVASAPQLILFNLKSRHSQLHQFIAFVEKLGIWEAVPTARAHLADLLEKLMACVALCEYQCTDIPEASRVILQQAFIEITELDTKGAAQDQFFGCPSRLPSLVTSMITACATYSSQMSSTHEQGAVVLACNNVLLCVFKSIMENRIRLNEQCGASLAECWSNTETIRESLMSHIAVTQEHANAEASEVLWSQAGVLVEFLLNGFYSEIDQMHSLVSLPRSDSHAVSMEKLNALIERTTGIKKIVLSPFVGSAPNEMTFDICSKNAGFEEVLAVCEMMDMEQSVACDISESPGFKRITQFWPQFRNITNEKGEIFEDVAYKWWTEHSTQYLAKVATFVGSGNMQTKYMKSNPQFDWLKSCWDQEFEKSADSLRNLAHNETNSIQSKLHLSGMAALARCAAGQPSDREVYELQLAQLQMNYLPEGSTDSPLSIEDIIMAQINNSESPMVTRVVMAIGALEIALKAEHCTYEETQDLKSIIWSKCVETDLPSLAQTQVASGSSNIDDKNIVPLLMDTELWKSLEILKDQQIYDGLSACLTEEEIGATMQKIDNQEVDCELVLPVLRLLLRSVHQEEEDMML